MKKPVIFLLIVSLCGSLCACRPEILPEGQDGNLLAEKTSEMTETVEQKKSKAASDGKQTEDQAAAEQNKTEAEPKPEKTDTEPDAKAEQTAVKDAEKPAETKQDGIKYFVETKDGVEWKVPEEDPALRAEAEKLRKINWNLYASFCADHDLQYSYDTTADDKMANDTILITLKHCCSEAGKIPPPFEKYVDFVSITERTFAKTPEEYNKLNDISKENFVQFFMMKVEPTSNEELLNIVHRIEKLPYVKTAYVNAPQVINR